MPLNRFTGRTAHERTLAPRAAMLWLVLAWAVATSGYAADAQDHGAAPRAEQDAAQTSESKEPVCMHGCLRWGKFCNVDPRGVYKCRRRCEKFGEICE